MFKHDHPGDPFRTCLLGLPLKEGEICFDPWQNVTKFKRIYDECKRQFPKENSENCLDYFPSLNNSCWKKSVIEALNHSASTMLQELDLLASVSPYTLSNATQWCQKRANFSVSPPVQPINGTGAIHFGKPWLTWLSRQDETVLQIYQNVTGVSPGWPQTATGFLNTNTSGGHLLPPGVFLICEDRAWNGIPRQPVGGPCYLGKLTLFTPKMRDLVNQNRQAQKKRSVSWFDEKCNDKVQLPSLRWQHCYQAEGSQ